MTETTIRRMQCRHIFTDGHRCGSPCLRNEAFCYYHHTTRRPKAQTTHDPYHEPPNQTALALPTPEDPTAIQHAIGEVLRALAGNSLDPRRAGLLLYGLQIASQNLKKPLNPKKTQPPPEWVEDVTDDAQLGPLAPAHEFDEDELPSSPSMVRWIYELKMMDTTKRIEELEAELAQLRPAATVDLEAGAPTCSGHRHKSRPKSLVTKTLAKTPRGRCQAWVPHLRDSLTVAKVSMRKAAATPPNRQHSPELPPSLPIQPR